ncbi:MAG: phosphate acetyltransferase [Gemmatimonas sp.]|nr:phosphate acetyltransferase [Gemmatimonas sp.]
MRRRIVFPEAGEPRIAEAALRLARQGLAEPIVLGNPEQLARLGFDFPGITIVEPLTDPRRERCAAHFHERRRLRGLAADAAYHDCVNPLLYAALLVAVGEADGSVAGATEPTAQVLRAALWAVGPAPGISTVSAAFYMVIPSLGRGGRPAVLTFADTAVIPEPTPLQLAEIALTTAAARSRVVGDEPHVAFLSYSTRGSAMGPSVARVREAVAIFHDRAPEVPADGELQLDAAIVGSIARRKAPDSKVAGRANVLIFPNLDASNIGYKLVERLGRAHALGPIVQGLARPCNDLSRGASVQDIVDVACITALMAQE